MNRETKDYFRYIFHFITICSFFGGFGGWYLEKYQSLPTDSCIGLPFIAIIGYLVASFMIEYIHK
ncbi:hypothetical protein HYO65_gp200 [Tenacibaculum phage PTm1]|uniref:Uncharacterized protein n=2 Tax=Shirahamavirus PTm1 TaxID=2846435 RepID=A0A5S9BZ47_9CAUD|nr:hypothetical protein HYO65_gp200 [Tenacibaculum phage PTm1]BBI90592.1 hypothetical protein [Tenacibaculum phage PTm1]BBI90900.1 hypothetical protein [Tenacibaculum phage PTm5]